MQVFDLLCYHHCLVISLFWDAKAEIQGPCLLSKCPPAEMNPSLQFKRTREQTLANPGFAFVFLLFSATGIPTRHLHGCAICYCRVIIYLITVMMNICVICLSFFVMKIIQMSTFMGIFFYPRGSIFGINFRDRIVHSKHMNIWV